jgi:release factor glutamine methyltransferase
LWSTLVRNKQLTVRQLLSNFNLNQLDKEVILADVLKCERIDLYKDPGKVITPSQQRHFQNLLHKYNRGCPVAYITGHKEFMSLDFTITKNVLIPRPETELLVGEAIKCIGHSRKAIIADIGTGSGNIAISIAKYSVSRSIRIVASDISKKVLKTASLNARHHRVHKKIRFYHGDLFQAFDDLLLKNKFDIIVSNPPYISDDDFYKLPISVRKYEPGIALFSGLNGLYLIRKIINQSLSYLKTNGYLLLEIGFGQSNKVLNLVKTTGGFEDIKILADYNKIPRVLYARSF